MEQTTSSAWPNVLALTYMNETGAITPEIEMKALEYVSIGYQKILTFECESGGFNWWEGDNPGNAILSAVGVMMLEDTKGVYDTVDDAVIQRSCDYLASVQKDDGAWSEEKHLHAGNENLGAGSLRATCYITWAMAYGCDAHAASIDSAVGYIQANLPAEDGNYTRGMCANALIEADAAPSLVQGLLSDFHDSAIVEGNTVHWTAGEDTLVNSGGNAADVEITSLVALAMMGKSAYPQDVEGAVEWLVQSKDPQGNWGYNTQATVLALRTFLGALTQSPGAADADVTVLFNGVAMASKHFDDFNKDVVWQVEVLDGWAADGNLIELEYEGLGALSYQIVTTHYVPWDDADLGTGGPLSITVTYDSTDLQVDDIVTATVTIENLDEEAKGMVLVTVGLPPGFVLVTADLDKLKSEGQIATYETAGKQLILYFDELPPGPPVSVSYGLLAQYPIQAQSGGAEVKYYYNAQVSAEDESQEISVTE